MPTREIQRICAELGTNGYSLSTFESIGLMFNSISANELASMADHCEENKAALELFVSPVEVNDLSIVQDETCMELGRLIVRPVVEKIFEPYPDAVENWTLFGINRYRKGGKLGPHRDSVDATILIITLSGERELEVYNNLPSEPGVTKVEDTFILQPGSILILDKELDPPHAVTDTKSPSMVLLADVPHALRL